MRLCLSRSKLFKFGSILLLLAFVAAVLMLVFRPASFREAVMPLPNGIPPQRSGVFGRFVPYSPGWFWLWRLKDSVVRHKAITLDSVIIDCADFTDSALPDVSLGAPQYTDTNGVQIWILRNPELQILRRRLEQPPNRILSRPRMQTADGVGARMGMTTSVSVDGIPRPVGLEANFFPRVHRNFTDLSTVMTLSETVTNSAAGPGGLATTSVVSLRTNLSLAARIQLPKETGVFLLNHTNRDRPGRRIGIFVSPHVPSHKKQP